MKTLLGKVISTKMKGAAIVAVDRFVTHPIYSKRIRRTNKYHVKDEIGVKPGEMVNIIETRPISKTITWKVSEIIKKNVAA